MAAPMIVIDNYYLTICFLISLAIQGTAFVISYVLQFDKITDFSGASNFFILALLTFVGGQAFSARNIIASVFVMVWAARLGGFLLFRVLKTGSDSRFDEMRGKILNFAGFWTFQLIWVWTVSLPVIILNSPNVSRVAYGGGRPAFGSATDIIGVIFWVIGFSVEAVGDQQKYLWKSNKPPKTAVNDKGVWGWTRHPNYFGEILLWWGIWLISIQPARSGSISLQAQRAQYASVLGPVFITLLLLFVSGMPTAEKPVQQRYYLLSHGPNAESEDAWPRYQQYLSRTSILFPLPPQLYKPLPAFVKKFVLLDLPFFQFNEHRDGNKAIEEAEAKERKKRNEQQSGEQA